MNTEELKDKAQKMKSAAEEMINSEKVQAAVEKGKEFFENGKGAEYVEKGKDALQSAMEKMEDFVGEKTDGKGIFGFGKKDN